jgi:hypothetical protein
MVLGLLRGGKSPIWWTFSENAFYYCLALSDPFGTLKYAPKNSGTRTASYGIKKSERIFFGVPPI